MSFKGPWRSYTAGRFTPESVKLRGSWQGMELEWEDVSAYGLGVEKDKLYAAMAKNMETPLVKTVGAEWMGTERIDIGSPLLQVKMAVSYTLAAYADRDIPTTSGRYLLEYAIRKRRWQWIRDVWLAEELRAQSGIIERHCGRRVWVDWLKGELPFKPPVVKGVSPLYVGQTFDRLASGAFGGAVVSWSNYTEILRAAVSTELIVRENVQAYPNGVGA